MQRDDDTTDPAVSLERRMLDAERRAREIAENAQAEAEAAREEAVRAREGAERAHLPDPEDPDSILAEVLKTGEAALIPNLSLEQVKRMMASGSSSPDSPPCPSRTPGCLGLGTRGYP